MPSPTTAPPPARGRSLQLLRGLVAFVGVALASLIVGGLTSPAQQYLPDEFSSFANSCGGWSLLAFLLVWASRLRPLPAAVAGAMSFVLMVEGYRIASEWRGYGYGAPFQDTFTFVGLLVGPVIGVSAALVHYGSPTWRVLAVAPLAAVLIGEGVYGLTIVGDTTSPVYWWVSIAGGLALVAGTVLMRRPAAKAAILLVVLTIAGSAAFWLAYQGLGLVVAGV